MKRPAAAKDRKGGGGGRRWALGFAVAAALAVLAFAANLVFGEVSPASPWGLTYGAAAAALVVAAAGYGARRRAMRLVSRLGLGRAQSWLRFHTYGGSLFLLLALMHSGFRVPSGTVTWWLWALSLWTVGTGWLGAGLQKWIPRVLGSGLAVEVLYERIPELVAEIRTKAEALASAATEPVQSLYARRVAPALAGPSRRFIYYLDITGGREEQLKEIDYLRRFLSPEEKEKLDELERLYQAKLEIDAHYTLQPALRWWLWLHLPAAVVLPVFLALHLFSVWYY